VEITVVGSGTVVPNLAHRQSCVVVEEGGETVVLDLGNGAVRGMLRAGLDPFGVDRVFFTHFHPDHTVDVVPLLFTIKYGAEEKRAEPLFLYGPEPFEGFFGLIAGVWGQWLIDDYLEVSEPPHDCPSPSASPPFAYSGLPPNITQRASPTAWSLGTAPSYTPATPSPRSRSSGWREGRTPSSSNAPSRTTIPSPGT